MQYDLSTIDSGLLKRRENALVRSEKTRVGKLLASLREIAGAQATASASRFLDFIEANGRGVGLLNVVRNAGPILNELLTLPEFDKRQIPELREIIAGHDVLAEHESLIVSICHRSKLRYRRPPPGENASKLETPWPYIECSPLYALLAATPPEDGATQYRALITAYLQIGERTDYNAHLRFSRYARALTLEDEAGAANEVLLGLPDRPCPLNEYVARVKRQLKAKAFQKNFTLVAGLRNRRERAKAKSKRRKAGGGSGSLTGRFDFEGEPPPVLREFSQFAYDGNPLEAPGTGAQRRSTQSAFHELNAQRLSVGSTNVPTPKAVAYLIEAATSFRPLGDDPVDTAARVALCCTLLYGCDLTHAVSAVIGEPSEVEIVLRGSIWRTDTWAVQRLKKSKPLSKKHTDKVSQYLDLPMPPALIGETKPLRENKPDAEMVMARANEILADVQRRSGVRLTRAMLRDAMPAALRDVEADEADVALITLQAPDSWAVVYTTRETDALRRLHRHALELVLGECADWVCASSGVKLLRRVSKRTFKNKLVGAQRTPRIDIIINLFEALRKATAEAETLSDRWNAYCIYVFLSFRLATMSRADARLLQRRSDLWLDRNLAFLTEKDGEGFLRSRLVAIHPAIVRQLESFFDAWQEVMEAGFDQYANARAFSIATPAWRREDEMLKRKEQPSGFVLIAQKNLVSPTKGALRDFLPLLLGDSAPPVEVVAAIRHFTRSYAIRDGVSPRTLMHVAGHGSFSTSPWNRHAIGDPSSTESEWLSMVTRLLRDVGWAHLEFPR